MTEEDEEGLKEMLNGILFILSQQQAKMLWVLETLRRMGADDRSDETMH